MSVFDAAKQSVTTQQAAELYGIHVNSHGMAVCPFNQDRNPSMKVDERFYCFGCQATGDVIDFTAKLFDLKPKDAAMFEPVEISHSEPGENRQLHFSQAPVHLKDSHLSVKG